MTSLPISSQNEPTTLEKMRGLRWSIAGDGANTIFVQFTYFGSIFILFLDALGLSKSEIGLLFSFFPFAGLIALLIAPTVARFGYKRTFLTFWGTRTVITAFLLLTPWVVGSFGKETAVLFIGFIIALFALCRAAGETGKYPWTQEYVPNQVRGKFTALDNLVTTIIGIIAVVIAGIVIDRTSTKQSGFLLLLAFGVIFGFISVWAYASIPGGAPTSDPDTKLRRDLGEAVNDRSFRNYLFGIALMTLATVPMTSFLPLFMQEEVGLRDSEVILLQNGTLIGGLVFVYIWGWAADRFGSMPIMLTGVFLRVFLPISWLLMPKEDAISLYIALGIAFLQGAANMGWAIGSARLLFVSIVPSEKKSDYMALYYAWVGVIGGFSQLIGGWILDASQNLSFQLLSIELDPYSPLFLLGLVLPLFSLFFFRGVQRDSNVSMGAFAGFLLRGNPFMAVESMIRYHIAKDEETAVHITERLGQAKSLLPMQELLDSLADPRFNVRFEAIVAIGRTRPDEQLIHALAEVLHGNDPALSVMAAWALGRIRDPRARDTLYAAMDSDYRSIRAHSARSLGTLGDETAVPELLRRLLKEPDHGLRVAYASALGQLQAVEAVDPILELLINEQDAPIRLELSLALARVVGDEHSFVQLARQTQTDAGTTLAQTATTLERKWQKEEQFTGEISLLSEFAISVSQGNFEQGFIDLSNFLQQLPHDLFDAARMTILQECAVQLNLPEISRLEFAILALHLLNTDG